MCAFLLLLESFWCWNALLNALLNALFLFGFPALSYSFSACCCCCCAPRCTPPMALRRWPSTASRTGYSLAPSLSIADDAHESYETSFFAAFASFFFFRLEIRLSSTYFAFALSYCLLLYFACELSSSCCLTF